MRGFFISLICLLFPAALFSQEVSQNLESYQVTVVGEQVILSGYKPLSKGKVFNAYLCDKNLSILNTYTKTLPTETKEFYVAKSGDLFVFTFYGLGEKAKYKIALDATFLEKYAAVPATKEEDPKLVTISDWTYDATYCNEYVIGDLMIDAQLEAITCYSLQDPIKGTYKFKWKKEFDEKIFYKKMELLGVNGRIAYFQAVELMPFCLQTFFAINIDDGSLVFTTALNKADSLDALSISSFLVKENTVYLGGTFSRNEGEDILFAPTVIDNADNFKRGYDEPAPYIIGPTDGYFLMTVEANSGAILKLKTFNYPPVDKIVDKRDIRLAICHGITILANGKMLAFYELVSSSFEGVGIGSLSSGSNMAGVLKWETDAFTSVIFNGDMSDFTSSTLVWEEESTDYDLTDFDLFSLAPMQEVPHDFCTIGDEGCYPQAFACDGTSWVFHLHSNNELIPDYLIRCNQDQMKSLKLLPPGLLLLRDIHGGLQLKDAGQAVKLKVSNIN